MLPATSQASAFSRRRLLCGAAALSIALHLLVLTALTSLGNPPESTGGPAAQPVAIVLQGAHGAPPEETSSPTSTQQQPVDDQAVLPEPIPAAPSSRKTVPTEAEAVATLPDPQPTPATPATPQPASTAVALPPVLPEPEPPPPPALTTAEQQTLSRAMQALQSESGDGMLAEEPLQRVIDGRPYRLHTEEIPGSTPLQPDRRRLVIETERNGQTLRAAVTLRRNTFARYAKFIDRWDDDVWLSGDEVVGRFHSNSRIRVETSRRLRPVFHGPVAVAARMYVGPDLRDPEIFRSGLETGVSPIPMPEISVDPAAWREDAERPGRHLHHFSVDTQIELLGAGGYHWQSDDGSTGRATHEEILYLVAEDGVELAVQGTVHGQVLVYSPDSITITGDLRYNRSPIQHPDSRDLLGLVSDHTVRVAGPGVTGRGDLEIHAAIYAGRRFSVRSFRSRGGDELLVIGSLTAGSVSATEPRYRTRIIHDDRFAVLRPPLFPQTTVWSREALPDHWQRIPGEPVTTPPGTRPDAAGTGVPAPVP